MAINPKMGGIYVVVERLDKSDAAHFVEYNRLNRPNLLEFTFPIDRNEADEDRVVIEIASLGEKCNVTLKHGIDAKWFDFAEHTKPGWALILEGFDRALSRS